MNICFFFLMMPRPPSSTRTHTLCPYTTLFLSLRMLLRHQHVVILTIPAPCPVFVGPAQAERKRRPAALQHRLDRSEEHTSELQSLMRISYSVFCLKKTKQIP